MATTKTITINGTQYVVKQTLRALFIWEQIAGRPFEIKNSLDNYLYYYSLILANNKDCELDWDNFIDALDEDHTIAIKVTQILTDNANMEKLFETEETDKDGKKKD